MPDCPLDPDVDAASRAACRDTPPWRDGYPCPDATATARAEEARPGASSARWADAPPAPRIALCLLAGMLAHAGPAARAVEPTETLVFTANAVDELGKTARAGFAMQADGGGRRQITAAGIVRNPDVSPLGRKIVYFRQKTFGLAVPHVCDWDGGNEVCIRPMPREHFQPRWSPDGREIVFASDITEDGEIYVMNADGRNARNLTWNATSWEMSPTWAPDGQRIAFIGASEGNWRLYVMERRTGLLDCIHSGPGDCREPAWSPDGRHIAFGLDSDGNMDLCLIDPDGRNLRRLTDSPAWEGQPAWNADSRRLAFVSDRDGSADLFIMDVTTGETRNLTRTPLDDERYPAWVPRQLSDQPLAIREPDASGTDLPRPRLLFRPEDLPGLRERFATAPWDVVWQAFLADCDALLDSASPSGKKVGESIEEIRTKPAGRIGEWLHASWKLALAWQVTGQRRYGDRACEIFAAGCRDIALYQTGGVAALPGWEGGPTVAACVYDWTHAIQSPENLRIARLLFLNACQAASRRVFTAPWNLGPGWQHSGGRSNWAIFDVAALGSPALALAGDEGYDPNWLSAAVKLTELIMDRWIDESGACLEGMTYFTWPLEGTMGFLVSLERNGLTDCLQSSRLRRSASWYAMSSVNGLTLMVCNGDVYNGPPRLPLGFLRLYPDDGLLDLLMQRNNRFAAPTPDVESLLWWRPLKPSDAALAALPRAAVFDGPGYAVLRSGHAERDPMLVLSATRRTGHAHAEQGALQLYCRGRNFIVDAGYHDGLAEAHSQVLVNGRGRAFPTSALAESCFQGRAGGSLGELLTVNATDAFATHVDFAVPSPGYRVRRFVRYAALVAEDPGIPPYFLLHDDCNRDGEDNDWTSQFILERDLRAVPSGHDVTVEPAFRGEWVELTRRPGAGEGEVVFRVDVPADGAWRAWALTRDTGRTQICLAADGKPAPSGVIGYDSRQPWCWQWRGLPAAGGGPLTLELAAGRRRVSVCPPAEKDMRCVLAALLLVPAQETWEPFDIEPGDLPAGAIRKRVEEAEITGSTWSRRSGERHGQKLLAAFLNPDPIAFSTDLHRMRRSHAPRDENVYVRLKADRRAVNPRFVTMLYPFEEGMPPPVIERRRDGDIITARVTWPGATDLIVCTPGGRRVTVPPLETDARLAVLRCYADGRESWLAQDAMLLSAGGEMRFEVSTPVSRASSPRQATPALSRGQDTERSRPGP